MKLLIRLLIISLTTLTNSYTMEDAAQADLMARGNHRDLMELQIRHNDVFLAFRAKNLRRVEEFINKTRDITQQICYLDPEKTTERYKSQTLLELACEFNMPEIILRLRAVANERKIDIDVPDEKGNTALGRAIIENSGDSKTITALLTQETINKQNNTGKTALHLFLSRKKAPTAAKLTIKPNILILLCKNGAKLDIKDDCGNTPIHYALGLDPQGRVLQHIIESSPFDIKQFINTQNKQDATPLHLALESFFNAKNLDDDEKTNCLNTIALLCEKGARIDIEDTFGNTPIHYALERDPQGAVLRILLVHNTLHADQFINVQNNDDATALHIAIESYFNAQELNRTQEANCLQTIEELLELGADIDIPNAAKITSKDMIEATADLKDECLKKLRAQQLHAFLKEFAFNVKHNVKTSPRTHAQHFAGLGEDNSWWGGVVSIFSHDE